MAPGTGKTFNSLKLVEKMAKQADRETFNVLYLVPSIQLLSQTLISWNNDTELSMHSCAVTSDRNASKKKNDDELSAKDIGFPATTDSEKLLSHYKKIENNQRDLTVVYSTYQFIEVVHEAQEKGFPEFDIIICDEAHRTTGAKALGEEASVFTRVHNITISRQTNACIKQQHLKFTEQMRSKKQKILVLSCHQWTIKTFMVKKFFA